MDNFIRVHPRFTIPTLRQFYSGLQASFFSLKILDVSKPLHTLAGLQSCAVSKSRLEGKHCQRRKYLRTYRLMGGFSERFNTKNNHQKYQTYCAKLKHKLGTGVACPLAWLEPGTSYISASLVLCTENASTCTSCFLNAKIAISRLGGSSPRDHAMQRTRVSLISDAATLDCWGFCFWVLLVLQSHFMKCPVDQPLHAVAWSLTAQCHGFASSLSPQKGCTFAFSMRKGLAEVFAVLWNELRPWTMPITQVQLALPQIPFWKQWLAEEAWEPWERGANASHWCRCPESQV